MVNCSIAAVAFCLLIYEIVEFCVFSREHKLEK